MGAGGRFDIFLDSAFSQVWASSLLAKFSVIFIPILMIQLFIKHFTTLYRWNIVYHSINFHLPPFVGMINFSTSFRVVAIFPVGHFITTPPLYENLEKYSPPLLIQPLVHLSTKEYWCNFCRGISSVARQNLLTPPVAVWRRPFPHPLP